MVATLEPQALLGLEPADEFPAPVTADEFFKIARGHRAELVQGQVIWMSPAGEEHGWVTGELHVMLGRT